MFGKNKKEKAIPALPPLEEDDYEEELIEEELEAKPKKKYKPLPKMEDMPEIEPPTSEEEEDDGLGLEEDIEEETEAEDPNKSLQIISESQLVNLKLDNLSKMVESLYPLVKVVADRVIETQKKKTAKKR